jgi:hypothetical protein
VLCWIDEEPVEAPQLVELLGSQREPLTPSKQIARALMFIPSLASFGLRRAGEPPETDFVKATATPLRCVWGGVVDIRENALRALREAIEPTDVLLAMEQRTGLQFVAEWYQGLLGDLVPELRLDELDEELRKRMDTQTPEAREVPAGVPPSHWWWRQP